VPRFEAIRSGKVEVTIEGNWQRVVNPALDQPRSVYTERTEISRILEEGSKRTTEDCGDNFVAKEHKQYAANFLGPGRQYR